MRLLEQRRLAYRAVRLINLPEMTEHLSRQRQRRRAAFVALVVRLVSIMIGTSPTLISL